MKYKAEWKIRVPWGKLALVSHGHPDGEPVFLVHGRLDSLSIFSPILDLLPDHYYYVAMDMPGNGLSDGFPPGPKLMRLHFLAAMEMAIDYLGWDHFIFMGHSMGCEQGLYFNAVHPNVITKMILFDAGPSLLRMQIDDPAEFQRIYYDSFYQNYEKEHFQRKLHTRTSAKQALRRLRDLNDPQCADLLERNFHECDAKQICNPSDAQNPNEAQNPDEAPKPDMAQVKQHMRENDAVGYLSWDNRLKNLAPEHYGNEYYFQLFKSIPPTLLIAASDGLKNYSFNAKWLQSALELLDRLAELENFHRVDVEGSHDVHFTHPERVAPHVIRFLKDNKVSSKL